MKSWFVRLAPVLALWPALAWAHTEGGQAAGFTSGFRHPLGGWDHILAMVAVGLWGAQLGPPALWILPVAFPLVMAAGAMLALLGIPVPGVETGIALSAVALGAMVLGQVRPPVWSAVALVAGFAIFHGHAHGTELPEGASGALYSIGFVVATGLLHATGIAIGLVHRWPLGRRALQAAGGVVAAGGIVFLWRSL